MANRIPQIKNYSFQGCLLVAAGSWEHTMYAGSVCLIVHHNAKGAAGIFLNRRIGVPVSKFIEDVSGKPATVSSTASLHFGGPMAGPVVALHRRQDLAEFMPSEGVYMAAQVEHLQQLLTTATNENDFRLIVGQTSWRQGVLDEQFREGKWLPLPITPELVFADEDRMWQQAMARVGDRFVAEICGCHVQPRDILAN